MEPWWRALVFRPHVVGQDWHMPLCCLICTPASETTELERIISVPFLGILGNLAYLEYSFSLCLVVLFNKNDIPLIFKG